MGTHPIFESDFDCLTEMSGRGESEVIFIPLQSKKGYKSSPLAKKIKAEMAAIEKTDFSFNDPSYMPFTDPSDPTKLNYDCPCVDNLPNGPCGALWRKFMFEKQVEKLEEEKTNASYREWFSCFSANASVYMPEFLKDMERKRRQAEEDLSNNIKDAEVLSQSETKWET